MSIFPEEMLFVKSFHDPRGFEFLGVVMEYLTSLYNASMDSNVNLTQTLTLTLTLTLYGQVFYNCTQICAFRIRDT